MKDPRDRVIRFLVSLLALIIVSGIGVSLLGASSDPQWEQRLSTVALMDTIRAQASPDGAAIERVTMNGDGRLLLEMGPRLGEADAGVIRDCLTSAARCWKHGTGTDATSMLNSEGQVIGWVDDGVLHFNGTTSTIAE